MRNPPDAWVEVDPGALLRGAGKAFLAASQFIRRHHDSTRADAAAFAQDPLHSHADVRVAPGWVPVRIRVDLGRSFDGWRSQRGYRWAVDPDAPNRLTLVTCSGIPVLNGQIPEWWHKLLAALIPGDPRVHVDWAPAVVYQARVPDWVQAVLDLAVVEAITMVAAGAKSVDCRAGHLFLWVGASGRPGRISKRWCPEHRREVRTLVMRYNRHGKPEDLQALQRLGYERKTAKRRQPEEKITFRR